MREREKLGDEWEGEGGRKRECQSERVERQINGKRIKGDEGESVYECRLCSYVIEIDRWMERERKRESKRESKKVCVCVRERERERER